MSTKVEMTIFDHFFNFRKTVFSRKNQILMMTSRDFLKQIFVRIFISMSFTYTSHQYSQKEIFAYLTRISHRSPPNYNKKVLVSQKNTGMKNSAQK